MALNPKHRLFVERYLICRNGKQAAIEAGYSAKSAEQQAVAIMKYPEVAKAIAEGMAEVAREAKIDAAWVLKRLAAEAEADISDLYDETGAIKPPSQWPLIWRQGLVQGIDTFEERDKQGNLIGYTRKIKLDSRIKRTELLGKHVAVQAFKEQIEHSGTVALADRIAKARARAKAAEGEDDDA